MRREREPRPDGPVVAGLSHRGFRVDDSWVTALLMTPTRADGWSPPPFDALSVEAVERLLDPAPEFLLLGTGATLRRPPPAFVRTLEARRIGVEAMDSRAAARAWGVLRGEGRHVAAAFYPLDA